MSYLPSDKVRNGRRKMWQAAAGKRRSAVAVVEFALLAPFLVFLALAVFEIARGIMIKQMLNDAARKACRTGALPGKTNADITADVNNILSDNHISSANATITITVSPGGATDVSGAQPGVDRVKVKVAIPVSSFYWISTYFLPGSTVESDSVTMLRQG